MNSFAHYYTLKEAQFREIPELVTQEASKIADEYIKQTKEITPQTIKQLKKIGLSPEWKSYYEDQPGEIWFVADLTKIKFVDLATNKLVKYKVYVALGKNNQDYAECDYKNKVITIFDSTCRGVPREKLVSIMVHEITHGFQQHKKYTDKYEKMKANNKTPTSDLDTQYYHEPIEFDAFTTEIAHTIQTEYSKLVNNINNSKLPETKVLMQRKLEKFLMELKMFIKSPLDTYFAYKELPLPSSLETFHEMLSTIVKTPKLWKKLKLKLINLYKKLASPSETIT